MAKFLLIQYICLSIQLNIFYFLSSNSKKHVQYVSSRFELFLKINIRCFVNTKKVSQILHVICMKHEYVILSIGSWIWYIFLPLTCAGRRWYAGEYFSNDDIQKTARSLQVLRAKTTQRYSRDITCEACKHIAWVYRLTSLFRISPYDQTSVSELCWWNLESKSFLIPVKIVILIGISFFNIYTFSKYNFNLI